MAEAFEPEQVDLEEVAELLRRKCGATVEGLVIGRTRFRDVIVQHLRCSQLEGEFVVDTMTSRGFLVRRERKGALTEWVVGGRSR